MNEIYIVIIEDRHVNVDVEPFTDRGVAITVAAGIVLDNGGSADDLNADMIRDGWEFHGTYGEDDSVRVVRRALSTDVLADVLDTTTTELPAGQQNG